MFQWTEVCCKDDFPLNYWQKDGSSDQENIHSMLNVGGKSVSHFATGYDLDKTLLNLGIEDVSSNECTSRAQKHVATSAGTGGKKKGVWSITDFRAISRAMTFDAILVENGNIGEKQQATWRHSTV